MNLPCLLVFLSLLSSYPSGGRAQSGQAGNSQPDVSLALRPSIAIVIGVFSIVFSLSFILLVYAKFCHAVEATPFDGDAENELHHQFQGLLTPRARFSGIDKRVIESLPFFRFSSLKGPREGLECSVCLSRFEDAEILRLLPKCKHAFHIVCVDRWLESHSSCPLCRCKVEVEDATLFKYSTSSRFLFRNSPVLEETDDHGIYIERMPSELLDNPSGLTCRRSFRKTDKDESLLPEMSSGLHKHMHRIILSDVVFKNRWSDMQSSDFISLKSEMLAAVSSQRFTEGSSDGGLQRPEGTVDEIRSSERKSIKIDRNGFQSVSGSDGNSDFLTTTSKSTVPFGGRSMSEIINVSRFADGSSQRKGSGEHADTDKFHSSKDEKMKRLWVPIARRTVQLFAGGENTPEAHQRRSESAV